MGAHCHCPASGRGPDSVSLDRDTIKIQNGRMASVDGGYVHTLRSQKCLQQTTESWHHLGFQDTNLRRRESAAGCQAESKPMSVGKPDVSCDLALPADFLHAIRLLLRDKFFFLPVDHAVFGWC